MNNDFTPQGKDPRLWRIAQNRASFKSHLTTYLLVNAGLWAIWYFSGGRTYGTGLPWPVWPLFGWGIGLVSHYVSAYHSGGISSVEKEYDKLTKNSSN